MPTQKRKANPNESASWLEHTVVDMRNDTHIADVVFFVHDATELVYREVNHGGERNCGDCARALLAVRFRGRFDAEGQRDRRNLGLECGDNTNRRT